MLKLVVSVFLTSVGLVGFPINAAACLYLLVLMPERGRTGITCTDGSEWREYACCCDVSSAACCSHILFKTGDLHRGSTRMNGWSGNRDCAESSDSDEDMLAGHDDGIILMLTWEMDGRIQALTSQLGIYGL